jgi:hypothetical protein
MLLPKGYLLAAVPTAVIALLPTVAWACLTLICNSHGCELIYTPGPCPQ